MMAFVTWFQKEAGQIVKGGTSEVTVVGSVLLINIIIIIIIIIIIAILIIGMQEEV